MRKILLFSVAVALLHAYEAMAQTAIHDATITGPATDPDPSAVFDAKSTNKGMLVPRVSLTATNSAAPIASPAASLLVYNEATAGTPPNNVTPGYYHWSGSGWVRLMTGNTPPLLVEVDPTFSNGGNQTNDIGRSGNITLTATSTANGNIIFAGTAVRDALQVNNNNITNANHITIADPGVNEGITWTGSAGPWTIDVSPLARTNADGNFNIYGTANNIALWRPTLFISNGTNYTTATPQASGGLHLTSTGNGHLTFSPGGTGNVGIGTTSPGYKLDVSGSIRATGLSGSGNRIVMTDNNGALYAIANLNGSGLGDNLGNHAATSTLDLNNNAITEVGSLMLNNGFQLSQGGSNYGAFNSWLQSSGDHGIYWPAASGSWTGVPHLYVSGGDYGSLQISGRKSGWSGLSLENRFVLMTDGGDNVGLYNDVDNEWMMYGTRNGSLYQYFNGLERSQTTTGGLMIKNGNLQRNAHHTGHLEGSYNSVAANDAKSNPIYTIGSSYNPTDNTLSNMYGIGYSHSNWWGTADARPGGWGQYVAADGDIRIILEASNGRIWASGDVRAPIYYDQNNTSFYVDPASGSVLRGTVTIHDDGAPSPLLDIRADDTSPWAIRLYNDSWGTGPQIYASATDQIYTSGYWRGATGLCIGADCRTSWASVGDNLGNHTATTTLNMNNNTVTNYGKLRPYGVSGDSGQGAGSYDIYQEAGGWTSPYPDLMIRHHTGVKISGHHNYDGVNIYTEGHQSRFNNDGLYLYQGWVRPHGSNGLYFQSYGGGWHMSDGTWIRSYNSKPIYIDVHHRADGGYQVDGNQVIDGDAGWHRTYGNTGWYNGTHAGGWYMEDGTWVRAYNSRGVIFGLGEDNWAGLYRGYLSGWNVSDGNRLYPSSGSNGGTWGYGYVGYGSDFDWYYVYSDNYVTTSARERKRSITPLDQSMYAYVLNDIDRVKPTFYKTNGEVDEWEEGLETRYRPNMHLGLILDESPDYIQDNLFQGIDLYSLSVMTLTGVKANREQLKLLIRTAEYRDARGEGQMTMGQIHVAFDEAFSEHLTEAPVVNITPTGPNSGYYLSDVTTEGFNLISATPFSFNWHAINTELDDRLTSEVVANIDQTLKQQLEISESVKSQIRAHYDAENAKTDRTVSKAKADLFETDGHGQEIEDLRRSESFQNKLRAANGLRPMSSSFSEKVAKGNPIGTAEQALKKQLEEQKGMSDPTRMELGPGFVDPAISTVDPNFWKTDPLVDPEYLNTMSEHELERQVRDLEEQEKARQAECTVCPITVEPK